MPAVLCITFPKLFCFIATANSFAFEIVRRIRGTQNLPLFQYYHNVDKVYQNLLTQEDALFRLTKSKSVQINIFYIQGNMKINTDDITIT